MKVLVTGGAGFIGGHLARALADRGDRVDLLDDFSRGVADPFLERLVADGARLVERDLLAPGALDGLDRDYDAIFHFAAIIGVRHVLERPYRVLRDNAAMTALVLDFALGQRAAPRFVFASTSEVTAGSLVHLGAMPPTAEDVPLALTDLAHPRTSYMLSKIYGEALCLHAGLPVTLIRPHNVYGPRMGMSHVVPELMKRARDAADGRLEVASVNHRRAFCHVDDAVEMILRLAAGRSQAEGVYNVGNSEAETDMGGLALRIIALVGKRLEIVPLPDTPGSPARRCPDMTRTVAATGYRAGVGLDEGLARTLAWYEANVFGARGPTAQ